MKNKIIIFSFGAIVGIGSFLFGMYYKENELSKYLVRSSVIDDSYRVATTYHVLKEYENGNQKEALETLRSWLESDISLIESYVPELTGDERKRIEGLLKNVEPYRKKSNKANKL